VSVGVPLTHATPPIPTPFATADHVEGDAIRAIDLGEPTEPPDRVAFLDGIQRYAVEGRLGLIPVVRGYVAAAVLVRHDGTLRVADEEAEEFVVVPLDRLTGAQRTEIESVGLPIYDCTESERSHPILDTQLAAKVVEGLRESVELRVARRHLAVSTSEWLVLDGSIAGLGESLDGQSRVLGVIKSHETQFLAGHDLEVALTLQAGHRTSVFSRSAGRRTAVYTWYLRLWPWEEQELLHGLVRVERPATAESVADATTVSRWLLAERAALAAPDGRWHRLLYPIRQVETYLRAQAGGWW
jgi:hypothetical protein